MTKSNINKIMNSKGYNSKTDFTCFGNYGFRGIQQREKMMKDALEKEHNFFFTVGLNKSFSIKDYNEFKIDDNQDQEYYELVKFNGCQNKGVPLYFDIEYYSSKPTDQNIRDFIKLMTEYMHSQYLVFFADNTAKKNWFITSATRKQSCDGGDVIYYKNSYHVIYRGYSREIYFENTRVIKHFIKNFYNWINDSQLEWIMEIRKNLYTIEPTKSDKEKKIIDLNPYAMTRGLAFAMRTIYSSKNGQPDSILKPDPSILQYPPAQWLGLGEPVDIPDYLIQYNPTGTDTIIITEEHVPIPDRTGETVINSKKIKTAIKTVMTSEIPKHIEEKATQLMQQHHPSATPYGEPKITEVGDYQLNYDDKIGKCLIHPSNIHSSYNGNYSVFYTPKNKEYKYYCRNCKDDKYSHLPTWTIVLKPMKGIIQHWDYNYFDRLEVDCLPLPTPEEIGDGGTFLLEAPKGSGKSVAMVTMLKELPKETSILVISYRRTLCMKYIEDLQGLNFTNYESLAKLDTEDMLKQKHLARVIICLDSIPKTLKYEIKQQKYDIIIMDEIKSLLEHFSSPLMDINRVHIQNCFEHQIRKANVVYALDAHLNNKLCLEILHELRDINKFTYHKNPNIHDYSAYKVHYNEVCKDTDHILDKSTAPIINKKKMVKITKFDEFNSKIIEDLKKGKKLAIVSSLLSYSKQLADIIKDEMEKGNIKGKILLYNSETDKAVLKEEISKPELHWGDGLVRCIIYTPTISAGISYNCIENEKGFNKVYAYLRSGIGVASLNTHLQMLFRLRQLKDKEYQILYDKKGSTPYTIEHHEVEDMLYNKTERLFECIGKSFNVAHLSLNIDANTDFKPNYNIKHWTYKLWKEITKDKVKYSKPYNFKKRLMQEFNNKRTDLIPGREMKWIDATLGEQQVNLSLEEIQQIAEKTKEMKVVIETQEDMKLKQKLALKPLTGKEYSKIDKDLKCSGDVNYEDIERYKLKVIERTYNIDLNIIREVYEKSKNQITSNNEEWEIWYAIWKKISKFYSTHVYKNQRRWKLDFKTIDDLENYTKFKLAQYTEGYDKNIDYKYFNHNILDTDEYKKLFGSKMTLGNNAQIIEQITTFGLQQMNKLVKVCNWIGIKPFSELDGIKIQREKFVELANDKELLNEMVESIKKDFNLNFESLEKYNFIRTQLQKFQTENPDTWLYDYDRDTLLKKYELTNYKSVEHLTEKNWSCKQKKKITKEAHRILLKNGNWTCAKYIQSDINQWTEKHVKTMIDKIFNETLAYPFEKSSRKIGDTWKEAKFIDKFENLIDIPNEFGEKNTTIKGLNALRKTKCI